MFLNFEKNRLKKYAVPTLFKDCTAPDVLPDIRGNDIAAKASTHNALTRVTWS